jgi:manganese/zinc/iron transport system permease protein
VLSTLLIEWLQKKARLQADAAIGLAFTFLFALGVILISAYAGQVDLDQECVLYGEIAYVPLDTWSWGGLSLGPRPVWILGLLLVAISLFIYIAYKPLVLTSFDPDYALALGVSSALWHYLLMGFVSLTTVLSFESVGAILVVAFLVGPASAAYLLVRRLPQMLGLALLLGLAAAASGYYLALALNGSIAGAMAVMIGVEVAAALAWNKLRGVQGA